MSDSILTSVKKALGLAEEYTAFDADILMHINSAFVTLNQLGIGPEDGFSIEDKSVLWGTFLGTDKRLNNVKTWTYLSVRLVFDPPATSFTIDAFQKQLDELTWRISVRREEEIWVPTVEPELEDV